MTQPKKWIKTCGISEEYQVIDRIGRGTYGTVFKAKNLIDHRKYAIKKLENNDVKIQADGFPITALRQINLLKEVNHPNIIQLKEILLSKPNKRNQRRGSTFLVFEYMEHDLAGFFKNRVFFNLAEIKCIARQLLEGVNYLHKRNLLHRDIKSANILVNDQGEVKVADFGLGRKRRNDGQYTFKVVTLWYRAPELILGCRNYDERVDVWSIGCVIAEFFIHDILFKKQTDCSQLHRILELLGDYQYNKVPASVIETFSLYKDVVPMNRSFERKFQEHFRKLCPDIQDDCLSFLSGLLDLNPQKRFTCEQALRHPFFTNQPKPCANSQIKKFDVEFHEMTKENKCKIERDHPRPEIADSKKGKDRSKRPDHVRTKPEKYDRRQRHTVKDDSRSPSRSVSSDSSSSVDRSREKHSYNSYDRHSDHHRRKDHDRYDKRQKYDESKYKSKRSHKDDLDKHDREDVKRSKKDGKDQRRDDYKRREERRDYSRGREDRRKDQRREDQRRREDRRDQSRRKEDRRDEDRRDDDSRRKDDDMRRKDDDTRRKDQRREDRREYDKHEAQREYERRKERKRSYDDDSREYQRKKKDKRDTERRDGYHKEDYRSDNHHRSDNHRSKRDEDTSRKYEDEKSRNKTTDLSKSIEINLKDHTSRKDDLKVSVGVDYEKSHQNSDNADKYGKKRSHKSDKDGRYYDDDYKDKRDGDKYEHKKDGSRRDYRSDHYHQDRKYRAEDGERENRHSKDRQRREGDKAQYDKDSRIRSDKDKNSRYEQNRYESGRDKHSNNDKHRERDNDGRDKDGHRNSQKYPLPYEKDDLRKKDSRKSDKYKEDERSGSDNEVERSREKVKSRRREEDREVREY